MKLLRSLFILCFLVPVALLPRSGDAQSDIVVVISPPELDEFPWVTFYVEVSDADGRRIPHIPSTSFQVIQDNTVMNGARVQEERVGTRQIYALATTIGLRLRDTLGKSRFDQVREALLHWWSNPEASELGVNDLSLITTDGVVIGHSSSAADLATRIDQLVPLYPDDSSEYDLLFEALEFADAPPPKNGMPTYLIFVTALPRPPRDLPTTNIIARAQNAGVKIIPVIVGPPDLIEQPEADFLVQIAEETGGRVLFFDETRGFEALSSLVTGQATQYEIGYLSDASAAGPHELQIGLTGQNLELLSEPKTFIIEVEEPEVMLIQPPSRIVRQSDDPVGALNTLEPSEISIPFILAFSDGHPRALKTAQLIVDGEVVSHMENPAENVLLWDISTIVEPADHVIQVSVEDVLGIKGESSASIVSFEIERPSPGLAALRPTIGPLAAALGILVAGIILAAVFLSSGRTGSRRPTSGDALPKSRMALKRAGLRSPEVEREIEARLRPFDPLRGGSIPLPGTDVVVGRDPSLASVPIDDASVEGLHARFIRQADGGYLLKDQGSRAGTWVNFRPLPEGGQLVEHGDRIHFGAVEFRFELINPPPPRKVRIQLLVEEDESRSASEEDA
jgi:hypothetical protein